jgi:regulator of sirC expression with transglutaminase-like and TPR domain
VTALNDYLFKELRFVGNDVQYEDPRNSFLNEVLDRRMGIPITLALLYMEVARRAGVSVGTLYQYFPHKEAIVEGLVHRLA